MCVYRQRSFLRRQSKSTGSHGYGLVYFTQAMLERHGMSFDGMVLRFPAPVTWRSTLSKNACRWVRK
ncbi:hypothetical protein ACNKHW_09000 [Shigella flexneri]